MRPALKTLLYSKGKWEKIGLVESPALPTPIDDVWRLSANLIGYVRIALVVGAGAALIKQAPFVAAAMIVSPTLFDWVAGPVARALGECSIFGSGVDWLADVLVQVVTLVWWAHLYVRILPVILAFPRVEMALSILDAATTMTGIYPVYEGRLAQHYRNPFYTLLD
jgi:phosphatidylglycerophosphate synthase